MITNRQVTKQNILEKISILEGVTTIKCKQVITDETTFRQVTENNPINELSFTNIIEKYSTNNTAQQIDSSRIHHIKVGY